MKNSIFKPYIGRIVILGIFILVILGASLNLAGEPGAPHAAANAHSALYY